MAAPKQIIFASAHRYDSAIRLGMSYLAEAMAQRGWRVLYIAQPTSPFHLFHPRAAATARSKLGEIGVQDYPVEAADESEPGALPGRVEGLQSLTLLPHVAKPGFSGEFSLNHWFKVAWPPVKDSVANAGFSAASAVVIDSPFFYPMARALGPPVAYRYADRLDRMASVTPAMLTMQARVFTEAELVVYTAHSLADHIGQRSRPSLYLPNGGRMHADRGPRLQPLALQHVKRPRVIYVGAMEAWLDWPLLSRAAALCPDVEFIALGRTADTPREMASAANLHVIDRVHNSSVPAFLDHCDVGLIPFRHGEHKALVHAINPLKLYEYMAAGLPVLASRSPELSRLGAPVVQYDGLDDFIVKLRQILAGDSGSTVEARRQFAAEASWWKRAEMLETAVMALERPAQP